MGNTFADWVSSGAIFGIQAFSAICAIILCFAALYSACAIIFAIARAVSKEDGKSDLHRD